MTESHSKFNSDFLRPFIIVIYSFAAAIGLYALRHSIFAGHDHTTSTVVAFNVGCGIIYLLGWCTCLAWSIKSFKLENTFPRKTQYLLVNLLGIVPIKLETDLFVRWQVKPFELEGLQILLQFVMGYIVNSVILGVLCLFMLKCKFPAKMMLRPAKITFWSVIVYVFIYLFCGILLFASIQNIYSGVYYHSSLYWMLVYSAVSIVSAY